MRDPGVPLSVFISYSRKDTAFVDKLEADLQARHFRTWVDRRKIEGGQDWRDKIEKAIDRCQVLVIVLSPDSVDSKWARMEYRYADEEGKPVIPLHYQPCKVPMDLRHIHRIDIASNYDQGLNELVTALNHLQASGSLRTPPQTDDQPRRSPTNPLSILPSQRRAIRQPDIPIWQADPPLTSNTFQQQDTLDTPDSGTPLFGRSQVPEPQRRIDPDDSTADWAPYGWKTQQPAQSQQFGPGLGQPAWDDIQELSPSPVQPIRPNWQRPQQAPTYVLRVVGGKELGRVSEIHKDVFRIGGSSLNDLYLDDLRFDPSHVSIVNKNGNYILQDTSGSGAARIKVNGTWVNRLTGRPLKEGDRIQIGSTVFVFEQKATDEGETTGYLRGYAPDNSSITLPLQIPDLPSRPSGPLGKAPESVSGDTSTHAPMTRSEFIEGFVMDGGLETVPAVVWCCIFALLAGLGATIGIWTQSWFWALLTIMLAAPAAYFLGYRKAVHPYAFSGIAVFSFFAALPSTLYAAGISYASSELVHNFTFWTQPLFWVLVLCSIVIVAYRSSRARKILIGVILLGLAAFALIYFRTLTLNMNLSQLTQTLTLDNTAGRQVNFGLVIGILSAIVGARTVLYAVNDDYDDLIEGIVRGLFVGVAVSLIGWLIMGIIGSFFHWGYGFGPWWNLSLLAMAISLIGGLGLGVSGFV